MAAPRPSLRNMRQTGLIPHKSPKAKHISPRSKRRTSTSEMEESDGTEFEGFDSPDKSLPRLPPNDTEHASNYSSSISDISCSPLKTDCVPLSERHVRNRNNKNIPTPTHKNSKETHLHRSSHGWPVIYIALFFLAISIVIFSATYYFVTLKTPAYIRKDKNFTVIYDEMKEDLRLLKRSMEQTQHLWIQVLGQIRPLVEESVLQPSVIIAIVPKNSQKTAVCLIDSLSNMIKNAFDDHNFVMFDVSSHLKDSKKMKEELDENLSGLSNAHAAVVYNIEKLPGDAAMMFHSYCDNENAPFKRAIIFLTLEVEQIFENIDARKIDSMVTQLLTDKWISDIREEDVGSLLARMANAPILIKPESNDIIDSTCDF